MKPTLSGLLAQHTEYRPERIALVFAGRETTFAQLAAEVHRLANAWLAHGLNKGDKVATLLPNGVELLTAYWAAAVSGIVLVPCSMLLQASGLRALLRDSDSRLVLVHPSQASVLDALCEDGDLGHIERGCCIFTATDDDDIPAGFQRYAQFTAGASTAAPRIDISGDDAYNIMYSSGTTGAPKGIVHTHAIRAMYCTLFANAWRMTPESVVLHAGALVFNGAMLTFLPWMYLGGQYILHEKFDPELFIEEIAARRVTHIMLVPAQVIALLNSPAFSANKLASLEMLCSLGAPLHLAYKQRVIELLPGRFYELYGVTEGFMTILDKNDAPAKLDSVGNAAAFTEVCIRDDNDARCAPGVIGEICGRGPLLMPGYYKQPELTAEAIRNGWLRSGDLGRMDADGFVYLVERKKDMIISGGANVYPKDIEEVVIRHPEVDEVAVFGVPDAKWGEAPVAAVTGGKLTEGDADDLVEWVNRRVDAKYQRISAAWVLPQFPRNAAGKILKRELRERYGGSGGNGGGGDDNGGGDATPRTAK